MRRYLILFAILSICQIIIAQIDVSEYPFLCAWAIVDKDDNALAFYSNDQKGCSKDAIITFERFLKKEEGKSSYDITDTVSVQLQNNEMLYITQCSKSKGYPYYIILLPENSGNGPIIQKVKKAWTYNVKSGKLIEVETNDLGCINGDYGG